MRSQLSLLYILMAIAFISSGCSSTKTLKTTENSTNQSSYHRSSIGVALNLSDIKDDKIKVNVDPDAFTTDEVYYTIPKIVPGTYRYSSYSDFIVDVKAYDYNGNPMKSSKVTDNIWKIENGQQLDKISYWVHDTFDDKDGDAKDSKEMPWENDASESESDKQIFPMNGTSFIKDKVFLLNLYAFVGYFKTKANANYTLDITSPEHLTPYTSLPHNFSSATLDKFSAKRYFEVADCPILYTNANAVSFDVEGTTVNFAVYSPSNSHKAIEFKTGIEKTIRGIKGFLKNVKTTDTYNILLYLATDEELDSFYRGITGALEHNTSTVIIEDDYVETEEDKEFLQEDITETLSHEFLHTVTPLNLHSEEIHDFDFNTPKMSQHLWLYEGVVEYFSMLFQVNQGLEDEETFMSKMSSKIGQSKEYEEISFTTMSANILTKTYIHDYGNVYHKGALIAMCLDILIREHSNGDKGLLWLVDQLTQKYGKDNPFVDDKLIDEIVALTNPEVKTFFDLHVIGATEIDYNEYLGKVGLALVEKELELYSPFFYRDDECYGGENILMFDMSEFFSGKAIVAGVNSFHKAIGLKVNDEIVEINGKKGLKNFKEIVFQEPENWTPDTEITFKIKRHGLERKLKGKVGVPTGKTKVIDARDNASKTEIELRNKWLKN